MDILRTLFSHLSVNAELYVLIGTLVAAVIALKVNQIISMKRATIDFVLHDLNSTEIQEIKHAVQALSDDELVEQTKRSNAGSKLRKDILRLLNHHEFLAVGISEGAFHKALAKRMKCSTIISTYDKLKPFIDAMRRVPDVSDTVFQDFESLAKEFKKSPLKKNKK